MKKAADVGKDFIAEAERMQREYTEDFQKED